MLDEANGAADAAPASDAAPVTEAPAPAAAHEETDPIIATMTRVLARHPDRGDDGTFRSRFPETKPEAEAPAAEITDQPETPALETAQPSIEPPASWSAEAKAKWSALSPDVQQIIADRESEAHKAITGLGEKAKGYDALDAVLGPRRQALSATWGSEAAGLDQLFKLSDFATKDPAGFVQWFAQQHRLNLNAPTTHADPAAPVDPRVTELERSVRALAEQRAQEQAAATEADIRRFAEEKGADGKPLRPHFDDLRADMGRIIGAGLATDLADAYAKAMRVNDTVRAKVEAEEAAAKAKAAEEAEAKRREAAAKAAADAKRAASVNVRTTGTASGSPAAPRTMDDTMRAVIEKHYGAGAV